MAMSHTLWSYSEWSATHPSDGAAYMFMRRKLSNELGKQVKAEREVRRDELTSLPNPFRLSLKDWQVRFCDLPVPMEQFAVFLPRP